MNWLPLHINLHQQPCLIIGGGDIAARKFNLLHRAEADITIIAPELNEELQTYLLGKAFIYHRATFSEFGDIQNYRLVIAATDQKEINRQISQQAQQQGVWVNV